MKKAITFRLQDGLLSSARDCAAREHRTLTNFVEVSLRDRIGEGTGDIVKSRVADAQAAGRSTRGE